MSHKQEFVYNNHHQIQSATETYDSQIVTTSYTYDNLWRQETTTTPSGLVTTDVYDSYGDVYQVKAGNKIIWEGKEQNSSGQWLKYTLGNGLQTNKTYSNRQELETIKTGIDNNGVLNATVQNLSYGYDAPTGNLLTRKDILNNRNEVFTYDVLDRLLTAQLSGNVIYNQTMTYQPNGNIDTKSDVGTYQYSTPRPNAMSGITGVQAGVSTDKQFITYSTFNKVTEIRQGVDETTITKKYNIYYGLDEQRIKSVLSLPQGGGLVGTNTRYYFGAYEKDIDKFGNATQTDYIYTPAGLTAMVKGGTLYYIHADNLGSIQAITDENKSIISSYYYTPWGGRVLLSGANITDRGYTFHEHLTEFGLINMNGRVYDPVLARFLSPDPYIQAPDYTQNFNRYSYCLNNPFKYTDPSGELQIGSFYVSLNLGCFFGGSSFGISAGVGFENEASAGIYIGYNTSGSFTFSANAGVAGLYATAGYDTQGGWFAGAGWSVPIPSLGIVSFNTNATSIGINYSQNGGLSGNVGYMQLNRDGMSFSPSVGMGLELYYTDKNSSSVNSGNGTSNSEATNIQLYEDETKAWNDMYKNAQKEDTEYGALITPNGIIQGKYAVDGGDAFLGLRRTRILGKSYVTFNKTRYEVLGQMHIHQRPGYPKDFDPLEIDGNGDYATIRRNKEMLFFLMSIDNKLHGLRYNNGAYRTLDKLPSALNLLLDGKFKLIPYCVKYHKNHNFDYKRYYKK